MDKDIDKNEITRQSLIKYFEAYPKSETTDIFKYIFQSAFGCEHLVSNRFAAEEYIRREYESAAPAGACRVDKLDGEYSRVHLSCLGDGLTPETLAKIFCLSAKKEPDGEEELLEKLKIAEELIESGELPIKKDIFNKKLAEWQAFGFPAVHHSDTFRAEYRPAYRVIANKYVEYLNIFSKIDRLLAEKDSVIIAIEGGSASGKSTLAEILSEVYDCNVFHMDDFFLRPEQRTAERLSEIGGNIDRERFAEEILKPLTNCETVCYRPFDCSTQTLKDSVTVTPKRLTVVEGVYSTNLSFERYYDLSIFLDISPELQKARILKRNSPQFATRFFDEWIPLENKYFARTEIKKRADVLHTVQK